MSTPLLSFRHAAKSFGATRAVHDVSFDVAPGEFCVLLGRSGAGKSTLLRAVNGLTTLTSGQVVFGGTPVDARTQKSVCRRVAMIHQQFSLVPRASVAANVLSGAIAVEALWRTVLGWYPRRRREAAWALVRRVGLGEEHLFRRAQDLSGGQQQRVGIARAFMLAPDLILADEPVASLDPKISRDVLQLLGEAARERGAAVLCSLHQLDLAREFGDRIVGIDAGRVVFDGPGHRLDAAAVETLYGAHVTPLHLTPPAPDAPRPAAQPVPAYAMEATQ